MSHGAEPDGVEYPAGRPVPAYTNVVGVLLIPQVLVSLFVVLFVGFDGASRGGACELQCDFDPYEVTNYALWVVLTVVTGLTLAGLIAWRRRGWKSWPIALLGLVLTILAMLIALQVFEWAYQPR